jgi:hypothetical protein
MSVHPEIIFSDDLIMLGKNSGAFSFPSKNGINEHPQHPPTRQALAVPPDPLSVSYTAFEKK